MVEITINVQKSSLNVRLQIWIAHEQFVHLKITFQRREAVMVFKSLNRLAPNYMSSKFIVRSYLFNSYNLRDSENKLAVALRRTNYYRNSFCYSGAVLWNNLSTDVRQTKSFTVFRKLLTSSSNMAFMENRL